MPRLNLNPRNRVFLRKRAKWSFHTQYVHKFQSLKIMRKIYFLKIWFFDDHFSFFRQLHSGPTNRSFKALKFYGQMGPTTNLFIWETQCWASFHLLHFIPATKPGGVFVLQTFSLFLHVNGIEPNLKNEFLHLHPQPSSSPLISFSKRSQLDNLLVLWSQSIKVDVINWLNSLFH